MSARPDMQRRQISVWLSQHNFPPGLTFFLDGIFTDPMRQKAALLKSIVEQVRMSSLTTSGGLQQDPYLRHVYRFRTNYPFIVPMALRRMSKFTGQSVFNPTRYLL